MRIGIVAPPWLPVPPPAYGGTETVLDNLARGLQAAGHDVLLFTTGDSTCEVPRAWTYERSLGVGFPGSVAEIRHVITAYAQMHDVDIVHDNTLAGPIYSAWLPELPVVTTNHGPFVVELAEIYRAVAPCVPIIAISHHQASTAGDIPIAAVIHHGIAVEEFPFGRGGGGYALFLGRLHPSKGAHVAARVARAAGVPLRIAGKLSEPVELDYFVQQVKPLLGTDIEYVGELGYEDKRTALGEATCLLNPIEWPEPFGMVMVEALACGTPVVTTRQGAAPEIVKDGVVGFVCDDEESLVSATRRIGEIDRATCRAYVDQHFSVTRMVQHHLALYEQVITSRRADPATPRERQRRVRSTMRSASP
jgi:glycosyltransferase involved in cell wall biosynthesis